MVKPFVGCPLFQKNWPLAGRCPLFWPFFTNFCKNLKNLLAAAHFSGRKLAASIKPENCQNDQNWPSQTRSNPISRSHKPTNIPPKLVKTREIVSFVSPKSLIFDLIVGFFALNNVKNQEKLPLSRAKSPRILANQSFSLSVIIITGIFGSTIFP